MKDVPEEWNRGMLRLLGLEVPSPELGLLQDIHWSQGLIGYFPSYSLGAIAAAQFFQAAEAEIPNIRWILYIMIIKLLLYYCYHILLVIYFILLDD